MPPSRSRLPVVIVVIRHGVTEGARPNISAVYARLWRRCVACGVVGRTGSGERSAKV